MNESEIKGEQKKSGKRKDQRPDHVILMSC